MKMRTRFPQAINPARVGKYPATAAAGGGFVWDAVLEYRVWCHPEGGAPDKAVGSDYYYAFASFPEARRFSNEFPGAEEPLALVLQKEYLDEPAPGKYTHVRKRRVAEWPVEFLSRPRRTKNTIPDFLSPTAPENRLDILRGLARGRRMEEPLFMAIRDSDPEFRQTVLNAQASLHEFRSLLLSPGSAEWYPCVKTRLTAGEESAFVWLLVVCDTATGFVASVFEIPPEFEGIRVGDEVTVADVAVMDWMVNKFGTLRGGFSLRYQRSKLPPERRAWFDQHVGVSHYAELGDTVDGGV